MKYLMGLILSFTVGFGAFAQDNRQDNSELNQCVLTCYELDAQKQQQNEQDINLDQSKQDQSEMEEPCPEGMEGEYTRRYENGSVYYHENPELRESSDEGNVDADFQMDTSEVGGEIDANAQVEQPESEMNAETNVEVQDEESTDVTSEIKEGAEDVGEGVVEGAEEVGETVVEGAEKVGEEGKELFTDETPDTSMTIQSEMDATMEPSAGLWKMANQCALHKELEERSGTFKIKKEMGDAELKVEREKDGEERLKYESDTEIYSYEKNEKGEEEYYYSIVNGNEMVEYIKGKDGITDVIYHGVFNNQEEANSAVESGVQFEGFSSVCTQ